MVSAPLIVLLFERTFIAGSLKNSLRRSWPLYIGLASTWLLLAALMLNRTPPRFGRLSSWRFRLRMVAYPVESILSVFETCRMALAAIDPLPSAVFRKFTRRMDLCCTIAARRHRDARAALAESPAWFPRHVVFRNSVANFRGTGRHGDGGRTPDVFGAGGASRDLCRWRLPAGGIRSFERDRRKQKRRRHRVLRLWQLVHPRLCSRWCSVWSAPCGSPPTTTR